MFIGAIAGVGGALLGAYSTRKAGKDAAAAQAKANEGDPRINEILYGKPGQDGLINKYQGMGDKPQDGQLQAFGQHNLDYLSTAPENLRGIQGAGAQLLNGSNAPRGQASGIGGQSFAVGNMVQAPSQNNMDLSDSYKGFIGGDRGGNTRLTSAIQGGIDQSKNMFGQMQSQATENLLENIMPSIRSNSVLSGQYGGSRQGIAEGNAIGDFAKAQQQAISQFGQNNTNAAVGAQANAYETDSNRALAATQGLGAQQYSVAQQDAATRNAAEFMNVGQTNQNYATNAAMQQQMGLANLSAEQGQNALNQNGKIAGAGILGGQMGQAYQIGQDKDNYAINQATKSNNLLAPYLSRNPVQPVAPTSNTAGGALSGAMMGLGLYNQFKSPYSGIGANDGMGTGNNYSFQPTALGTNAGALQNMDWLKG